MKCTRNAGKTFFKFCRFNLLILLLLCRRAINDNARSITRTLNENRVNIVLRHVALKNLN